jgi:hypothetical protein
MADALYNPQFLADFETALAAHGSQRGTDSGRSHMWQCPIHDDSKQSLAVGEGEDGTPLIYCHSCSSSGDTWSVAEKIGAAVGVDMETRFITEGAKIAPTIDWATGPDEIYDYRHLDPATGKTSYLFSVLRFPGKQFRQVVKKPQTVHGKRVRTGSRWKWRGANGVVRGIKGVEPTIYRQPRVDNALKAGEPIYIVEGERDVQTLEGMGLVATCNPGGAGKWKPEFSTLFRGTRSHIFIIPDMDGPAKKYRGERHALAVADSLQAAGVEAKFLRAAQGKDATDHAAAGLGVPDLVALDRLALAQMAEVGDTADNDDEHLTLVHHYKATERARTQARAELAAEGWEPPPDRGSLKEALTNGVPDVEFTIDEIVPRGANILLNAQWKKGKTTAVLNVARSLTDGAPVFGSYPVHLPTGGVTWWNAEMDDRTALRWLNDMNFARADRMFPLGLRGYRFPLGSAGVRDWAVNWLQSRDIKVWALDPFGTLYDGEENSNSEVREWLKAVDEIKRRASVEHILMVAHTGHMNGEDAEVRARGAARLMDWADVILTYRAGSEIFPDRRYLSGQGRDVDLSEIALDFDAGTRLLTLAPEARSRAADQHTALTIKAADIVISHFAQTSEPINKSDLEDALGKGGTPAKRNAIREAVANRWVRIEKGPNRSQLHYPGDVDPKNVRVVR